MRSGNEEGEERSGAVRFRSRCPGEIEIIAYAEPLAARASPDSGALHSGLSRSGLWIGGADGRALAWGEIFRVELRRPPGKGGGIS